MKDIDNASTMKVNAIRLCIHNKNKVAIGREHKHYTIRTFVILIALDYKNVKQSGRRVSNNSVSLV